jgi:hypothetical protein
MRLQPVICQFSPAKASSPALPPPAGLEALAGKVPMLTGESL